MRCKICGAENLEDAKYCEKCGSSLESNIIINNDHDYDRDNNYLFMKYRKQKETYATISLVLGIICLIFITVLCCFDYLGLVSLISGILSIIFAILGWEGRAKPNGRAIAGLICGIIGVMLTILYLCFVFFFAEDIMLYIKENYPDIWETYFSDYN